MQLWRRYVLSNLHIALCAVIFCWGGYAHLRIEPSWWLLGFIFSGTLCTYTVHRLLSARRVDQSFEAIERFSFIKRVGPFQIALLCGIILIALFSYSMLEREIRIYLGLLTALSIGYVIPVMHSGRRLRDISMLKIFLVAIVWAGIFFIPLFENGWPTYSSNTALLFFEKFLFIFALTIPFDLRDERLDKSTDLQTIAGILSPKNNKILIGVCLFICIFLVTYLGVQDVYSAGVCLLLTCFYFVQGILSFQIKESTPEIYYLGVLDGIILVHGVLFLINF